MLVRLADRCFRHRRLVVLAWVAALVGAFGLAGAFGGDFKQDYLQPGSESQRVSNTLKEHFPQKSGDTIQVVVHSDSRRDHAGVQNRVETILAEVADADHVVEPHQSLHRGRGPADLRGRHHGLRRRRPRQDGRRVHCRGGHGIGRAHPRDR